MSRFVLLITLLLLSGCVSYDPERRPIQPQPDDVTAATLLPAVKLPEDTDANGYPDAIDVIVYVFGDKYVQASIYVPGEFDFKLVAKDGTVLSSWRIDKPAADAALRKLPPGPGYVFRLSMLAEGTDKIEAQSADLRVSFIPIRGAAVTAPATTLRVGKTGA